MNPIKIDLGELAQEFADWCTAIGNVFDHEVSPELVAYIMATIMYVEDGRRLESFLMDTGYHEELAVMVNTIIRDRKQ